MKCRPAGAETLQCFCTATKTKEVYRPACENYFSLMPEA